MQVFTLFKTSRTHMFLACRLVAPAPSHVIGPDGVVAVRSQQDLLAGKDGKEVTGTRPRECCVGCLKGEGFWRVRAAQDGLGIAVVRLQVDLLAGRDGRAVLGRV